MPCTNESSITNASRQTPLGSTESRGFQPTERSNFPNSTFNPPQHSAASFHDSLGQVGNFDPRSENTQNYIFPYQSRPTPMRGMYPSEDSLSFSQVQADPSSHASLQSQSQIVGLGSASENTLSSFALQFQGDEYDVASILAFEVDTPEK
jgi:hypothetical protein